MFIYDKPIESESEDFLSRTKFSRHLGKALTEWKEKESLVIAIYGEWGSGKSSVINLATKYISNIKNDDEPIIIRFNPWNFSEEKNLTYHFFNEIAKELKLIINTEKYKKIAENLELYAQLLSLVPQTESIKKLNSQILVGVGLTGMTVSQVLQWLGVSGDWTKYIFWGIGLTISLIGLMRDFLNKLIDFFRKKNSINQKSVTEIKNLIVKELLDQKKKIVIVIDDIDRLNQSEIRQIFRLIRINADFPNTIYLLAFDRKIVEQNLEEQAGVSGKDYLDKIVQVQFNLPMANPSRIEKFLFMELDRILMKLPASAHSFFGQDKSYWTRVYSSGFKDFFRNLRDVKRFVSSLEFNLSQMYQGESMEVNPIDFIAVEGIRIFAPDFYTFMRGRSILFTSDDLDKRFVGDKNPRKIEIDNALNNLPPDQKKSILGLLKILFPQVDRIFQNAYVNFGQESHSNWSRNLRVCSKTNYDSYFNLIPGGDENALSQFEIDAILATTDSINEFQKTLDFYIEKKKLRKVLGRLKDYAYDESRITKDQAKIIIQAIFNISDNLPDEKYGFMDFGIESQLMQIISQLLKRDRYKEINFEILKDTIIQSQGLFGPFKRVSLEVSKKEKGELYEELLVPNEKIEDLKKLCVEIIKKTSFDELIKNKKLPFILLMWKRWSKEGDWKNIIQRIKEDEKKLLEFLGKCITESEIYTSGEYDKQIIEKFDYQGLSEFIDIEEVKTILEGLKRGNSEQYQNNKKVVDLFLNNFNKIDNTDFG